MNIGSKITDLRHKAVDKYGFYPFLFYVIMFVGLGAFYMAGQLTEGAVLGDVLFSNRTDTFMDFYNSIRYGYKPYEAKVIYPPLINCIFAFFSSFCDPAVLGGPKRDIANTQNGQMALVFFLLLSILALIYIVRKTYGRNEFEKLLFCGAVLFCEPVLFSVERGNSIILCAAALAAFCFFYDSENNVVKHLALISLAVAVSIKIYVVIFGLLLIRDKRWKDALYCIIYGIVIFFLPFIFLDGSIFDLLKNITSSKGIGGCSFRYNITNAAKIIGGFFPALNRFRIEIVLLLAAAAIIPAVILFFDISAPKWKMLCSMSFLLICLPGFSFTYSLIFLLIPLTEFLKSKYESRRSDKDIFWLICFALMLIPFGIHDNTNLLTQFNNGTAIMNWDTIIKNAVLYTMVIVMAVNVIYNFVKNCDDLKNKAIKAMDIVAVICLVVLFIASIAVVKTGPSSYAEIDSYALPIVSIQHRGSIIMTQADIEQAKIDFPNLYKDVNGYDDLRSAKLIKIDEDHWLSYYFPVYSVLCIPAKIGLQILHLNQEKSMALTNALMWTAAMVILYLHIRKTDKSKIFLLAMMAVNPIILYLNYQSAEAVMGSLMIIAIVLWRERKMRSAALIISITCMAQPVIMGVGIVIFADYLITAMKENKKFYSDKAFWKNTLLLCCCYIPSLIPFIVNKALIGTFSVTAGLIKKQSGITDTILDRFLEYFFDLNLGMASFAALTVLLFVAAFIYSIVRKKYRMFMECSAAIFLTFLVSFATNINSGMICCARYVIWIYPVVVFAVHEFIEYAFKDKLFAKWGTALITVVCTVCLFSINGIYYIYNMNNLTTNILDRIPQLYVTFCDSTFNAKVNGLHGGYDLSAQGGYAIYYDSDTDAIRKILYKNTDEVKMALTDMLYSKNDADMSAFAKKFKTPSDGKQYYICISRYDTLQYYPKTEKYIDAVCQRISIYRNSKALQKATTVFKYNEAKELNRLLTDNSSISDEDYVISLYNLVLKHPPAKVELADWTDQLEENEVSREEVLRELMLSTEFRSKAGIK